MKILVTGAAGFIGSAVSAKLIKRGDSVVGIDNVNSYYDVNLKLARLNELIKRDSDKRFNFIKMDISDSDDVFQLFEKQNFDIVIHLAAQAGVRYSLENPHAYVDTNLSGFTNILEGCRHNSVSHLVYASSSSVYGANEEMPFKEGHNVDHPVSLYAATKKANELMAHTYSHLFKIPTSGLRFFTVYGPWGRPDMALFKFTKAILTNENIKVFNYGDHYRDFTYIDDIVEGIIRTADKIAEPNENWSAKHPNPSSSNAPWRIYNIGAQTPVHLLEFIETLEEAIGIKAKKELLPMQAGDVAATYADVNLLEVAVGYTPKVSIKDGIEKFVKWYREYYRV